MGQQQKHPHKNPQTHNPGQKMPGQQEEKHRQAEANQNEWNKSGSQDQGMKSPKREHDE